MTKEKFVFHLQKKYFSMIKCGLKNCEYRPQENRYKKIHMLLPGDIIRFDLGYSSLKIKEKHIYKKVIYTTLTPLYELPKDVQKLYKNHDPRELFHDTKFENI